MHAHSIIGDSRRFKSGRVLTPSVVNNKGRGAE